MSNISDTIDRLCQDRGIKGSKMCDDLGMSRSFMTELRKGRAKSIKAETAQKIADYFGVSVGYLLGTEKRETVSATDDEQKIDHRAILAAFWEGSEDLPEDELEALWNDASDYIRFKMDQRKKK